MTTTNEIPAGALYGMTAERITRPNDGETIETRLGRLEEIAKNVVPGGGSDMHYKARLQGHDAALDALDERLARIEAWMRNEIFARTAMDEPDPDAGEDAKWGEVANANNGEWFRVKGQQKRDADHLPRWMAASKVAVAKAIELGLAVSPDDPRLHPLVVTDDTVRLLRLYTGMYWTHGPGKGRDDTSTAPNESLRFGLEMLFGDLNAAREVER